MQKQQVKLAAGKHDTWPTWCPSSPFTTTKPSEIPAHVRAFGFRRLLMTQIIYNVFWKRGTVSIGSQSREHLNIETRCCTAISSSFWVLQCTLVKSMLQCVQWAFIYAKSNRKLLHFYYLHSFSCRELCACRGSMEGFARGAPVTGTKSLAPTFWLSSSSEVLQEKLSHIWEYTRNSQVRERDPFPISTCSVCVCICIHISISIYVCGTLYVLGLSDQWRPGECQQELMWLHFKSGMWERWCMLWASKNDISQIGISLEACVQRGDQSFSGRETFDGESRGGLNTLE